MSTKSSVRYQEKEGELPAWHLYREAFETEDVVYLEIEGIQVDVTMIGSMVAAPNTVLLRLPTATARQLGLLAPVLKRE
ncbi:hypothetical protein [Paraburkholderia sp. HP33-1]|uniref:hypothetical protein n=1 Tax=Paraburkholderia sp. HP33-1 TaxID=2883243 RepID=UPI001F306C31|nr:hypothetical protein [Paraburkholderia sp. HP33-1]